jgi:hypothetical protein
METQRESLYALLCPSSAQLAECFLSEQPTQQKLSVKHDAYVRSNTFFSVRLKVFIHILRNNCYG